MRALILMLALACSSESRESPPEADAGDAGACLPERIPGCVIGYGSPGDDRLCFATPVDCEE